MTASENGASADAAARRPVIIGRPGCAGHKTVLTGLAGNGESWSGWAPVTSGSGVRFRKRPEVFDPA
jgi:hypothetical protein